MADRTCTLGNSLIQHGRENDRVYLMDAADADLPGLLVEIEELADRHGYGKIFAKVRAGWQEEFIRRGYRVEAEAPGLYPAGPSGAGRENGLFMGKFLDPGRTEPGSREEAIAAVIAFARSKAAQGPAAPRRPLADHYRLRPCGPEDCPAMAALLARTFASYPFPVSDPAFLRRSMDSVLYYGSWQGERLAAVASAELAPAKQHAEMTDFATAPEDQGRGLAAHLLAGLETAAAALGIRVAYTIARAESAAINITFARAGYAFNGTLVNNTQICGRLESMNVWSKSL